MFALRQINNKINTTVVSMSVICLMLFMTITILSSSLLLRNTTEQWIWGAYFIATYEGSKNIIKDE